MVREIKKDQCLLDIPLSPKKRKRFFSILKKIGVFYGAEITVGQFLGITSDEFGSLRGVGPDYLASFEALKAFVEKRFDNEPSGWAGIFLGLSVRTKNALSRLSVSSPETLLALTQQKFMSERGVGKKCWVEIANAQKKLAPSFHQEIYQPQCLEDFRLFSGVTNEDVSVPKAYLPDTPTQLFVTAARSREVLKSLRIETLGNLLLAAPETLLKQKNCGKKTVRDLRSAIKAYLEYCSQPNKQVYLGTSLADLMKRLCNDVGILKYADIFVQRVCEAKTLEAVGCEFGCTRERVRQIVKLVTHSFEEFYKTKDVLLIVEKNVSGIMYDYRGVLGYSRLCEELSACFQWELPPSNEGIREFLQTFPSFSRDYDVAKESLKTTHPCRTCEYILEAFSGYIHATTSQSVSVDSIGSIEHLCAQNQKQECTNTNLKLSREFLIELAERSGLLCDGDLIGSRVAMKLRKGGLESQIEAVMEASGGIHTAESVWEKLIVHRDVPVDKVHRALIGVDDVYTWGRGNFIHRNHIHIDESVIKTIRQILALKLATLPFVALPGIFKEFCATFRGAGIPNDYALATVIAIFLKDFHVNRYRYVFAEKPRSAASVQNHIARWVLEQDAPVSVVRLKQYMVNDFGMRESAVQSTLQRISEVIPEKPGYVVHIDAVGLSKQTLSDFSEWISDALRTYPQIGVHKLYKERSIACFQRGIHSARMLYFALDHFFSDKFDFSRFPYIAKEGETTIALLSDAVSSFLCKQGRMIPIESCIKHFETLGYSSSQLRNRIPYLPGVFQCYPGCIIHSNVIGWNDDIARQLYKVLLTAYKKRLDLGYLTGDLTEVYDLYEEQLPSLHGQQDWTGDLLVSAASLLDELTVMGNANRAYSIASIPDAAHNINELVVHAVRDYFKGGCSRHQLTEWMVENGVVRKQLTDSMFTAPPELIVTDYECLWKGDLQNG